MADQWTHRLSEYIDDELDGVEHARVDAHVATCADCATTLAELRAVAARAAVLGSRPPANDLWPGIEARLARRARVALFGGVGPRRRFSFTIPQLVAAGLALMVLSGGAVWLSRIGGSTTSLPPIAANTDTAPGEGPRPVVLSNPQYDQAIADLERALEAGRARLDPETVRVLERNLQAIDEAIEQSQRALAQDPVNRYLNSHLAEARQRKLALLRQASALVGPRS